jgi:hypothetical protein
MATPAYTQEVENEAMTPMTPTAALVIGYSDQIPNDLRAYRLMSRASGGAVLLTRHGATYSSDASDVSAYPQLLESMLSAVLKNIPAPLQARAEVGLTRRWNRDWGVEAAFVDAEVGFHGREAVEHEVGPVRGHELPDRTDLSVGP